jgi:hypothetical protein
MRKKRILPATFVALLAFAGTASAIRLRGDDILVVADGGFKPKTLPRDHDAPITLHGGGRISTISGALPPVLSRIDIEYDKHGHVETRGLPICVYRKLVATDVAAARRNCHGSIVGKGRGSAVVKFPDQAPIHAGTPITIFNGPRKHGNPTVYAHGYLEVGGPTTFIVPVEIQRIHKGTYGYRTVAEIPKIAGGYGIPISGSLKIGRKWTYRGKRLSYINARCQTGHLQARGSFDFKDGTHLSGTFAKLCKVRR